MVEWSFINHKCIDHGKCTLNDIKLTKMLNKWTSKMFLHNYVICQNATYPETQLILMCVSLFCKLSFYHPLPHGPISNTAWSVPIIHYYLPYRLSHAIYKLWIPWPLRLNDNDGCIVLMDSMMSDIQWWWPITCNYLFCIVLITDEIVQLC